MIEFLKRLLPKEPAREAKGVPGPQARKAAPAEGQRRSERVVKKVEVVLSREGHNFPCETAVLNVNGCLLLCPVDCYVGADVVLKYPRTSQTARAKVVWDGGKDGTGLYKLGIEFKEAVPDFWGADYPG